MGQTEITITIPNTPLKFTSECTFIEDNESILINTINGIHYKDKFLSFGDVNACIETVINGRLYKSEHCQLKKTRLENQWGYKTDSVLKAFNRRGAARISCHEGVVIQKGANRGYYEGITYNVSLTGLGIYAEKTVTENVNEGDVCDISIFYKSKVIKVSAVLVRNVDNENGYLSLGFLIQNPSIAYTDFVMEIQRRALKVKQEE